MDILKALLKKAGRRLVSLFYVKKIDNLVLLDLKDRKNKFLELPTRSYFIKKIDADAIKDIASVVDSKMIERIEQRLDKSIGLVLYKKTEILGWIWLTESPRLKEGDADFHYPISPLPEHLYLYDGFILPGKRGHGYGYYLVLLAIKWCAQNMYHHFLFFTHDNNNKSMKSIAAKLGFKLIGQLYYHRFLWKVTMDTTSLKQVSIPNQ